MSKRQRQEQQQGQDQQQQREDQQEQRKKKKIECIYGNYPFYYGYRVGKTPEEDPRVSVFQREWIEGKDCLDIGCNEGYVTISLAAKFGCKSMLGVDIDSSLIYKARCHLRQEMEELERQERSSADGEEEKTGGKNGVEKQVGEKGREVEAEDRDKRAEEAGLHERAVSCRKTSLARVAFKTQNYLEAYGKPGSYDTILCLSVSKWIHLNWGDDGLLKFFAKIFRELRPGGCLILEPQPWSSYSKKRRVSKVARENFQKIVLKPDDFPDILIEKIGFASQQRIFSQLPSDKSGFRRPLFLYRK